MSSNWLASWHPAPRALEGVLAGIWSVRAGRDGDLSARVLPDGSTSLALQRDGTALRSGDADDGVWAGAFVSGPRSKPFDFDLGAGGHFFIVQLQPAGAMRVLGVPMSALANRFEALDAVVSALPARLSDSVLGAADAVESVRAIEAWLVKRVHDDSGCVVTDAVVHEVTRHAGNVRVRQLADDIGLSRRHLGRIIRERLGTPPKLFARVTRFDRAVQLARARPPQPWAHIALEAGYADQAHMIREFAELGGIRPSDLRGAESTTIW